MTILALCAFARVTHKKVPNFAKLTNGSMRAAHPTKTFVSFVPAWWTFRVYFVAALPRSVLRGEISSLSSSARRRAAKDRAQHAAHDFPS
jgi:hypothetical protein